MSKDNIEEEAKNLVRSYICRDCNNPYVPDVFSSCDYENECESFQKAIKEAKKELEEEYAST